MWKLFEILLMFLWIYHLSCCCCWSLNVCREYTIMASVQSEGDGKTPIFLEETQLNKKESIHMPCFTPLKHSNDSTLVCYLEGELLYPVGKTRYY